jgi:phosphate transport system substrate-binding protein
MRTHRIAGIGLALLALNMAGCGGGEGAAGGGAANAGGEVVVDGSSTVFRISKAAQEKYSQANPDAEIIVSNHGTGGGFGRYLQGEVDIIDASREAKPEEESGAKQQGLDWTRFLVAHDGITVVVNPRNDFVKSLSVGQLKAVWEPDSKVRTWKDIDPSWPDRKVVLFSPDNDSGTFDFFVEAIVGKAKGQRQDVQASSDDNTLVSGVEGDLDALGYFGYAYYAANAARLRAVPIQNGPDAPPVAPTPETIFAGAYTPLSRPLFIYVKDVAMRRPEVAGFVTFYVEHAEELAQQAGYVAPTAEDRAANAAALKVAGGK